jgi:nitrite reductase/ring-hydroxylating ferredoxin subunit
VVRKAGRRNGGFRRAETRRGMHSLVMPSDDKGAETNDRDAIELDEAEVPSAGGVRRVGPWAVGRSKGEVFAVSRRCRHQLGDLSQGRVDADGCLVCPWHQSRYDVRTGAMVSGPKGFLGSHGPTPGYTQFVLAYGRVLRLRVASVVRQAGRLVIR